MREEIRQINALAEAESAFIENILQEFGKVIVGQTYLAERLLIGLLCDGHLLLEGVPGLGKTLAVKTLSEIIQAKFQRIQFTPDLLPSDLLGTLIYNQATQEFIPKLGPIFANFILADEINRAPAKVQSALLEAMQEKQVTLGGHSYKLEDPFLVLATQNPIEQEGTYHLPEAQIDRFFMKLNITYPTKKEEKLIIDRVALNDLPKTEKRIQVQHIQKAKQIVKQIYVDEKIKDYVVDIVFASREPEKYNLKDLANFIEYGASPRASISLIKAAKAHAFLRHRGYVTPEDIKAVGKDVLRHRIIPSFEAEAEEIDADKIVSRVFNEIEVP
ncbi:MoxR family ATPase [bacterium]|jgi:MoxR-like ATPase|nr:MoxR family ATPase [bacterium]MBT3581991.1 MoxR family ATPase [bacterium]MBT4552373.1 MoxR family ATPase [bacterium]MBT7088811.1 MoxR family ATPase [bacterium]